MLEVSEAIKAALDAGETGDGDATGVYEAGAVPRAAVHPFVTFQKVAGSDRYTFGARAYREVVYLVKAIGEGHSLKAIGGIMNDVDADLTDGTLTVSGYGTMSCRREREMPSYSEEQNGITYQHVGAYYRIFVAPS